MFTVVPQGEERILLCQNSWPGSLRSQKHCSSIFFVCVCDMIYSLYLSHHTWLKCVSLKTDPIPKGMSMWDVSCFEAV